jgi:hypothetical protein
MFKRLKNYFYQRSLQHRLKTHSVQHSAVSIASAQSVFIFFDADDDNNYRIIKKFTENLIRLGKTVEVLGYYSKDKKEGRNNEFSNFGKKDVNWFSAPDEKTISRFSNQQYDLLLNFYTKDILPLEYLSAVSNATCRVGRFISGKTYYCDLMISLPVNASLEELTEQAQHYLTQLKPLYKNATA